MVQATDFGDLHDPSRVGELDWPGVRRILVEREVRATLMIILEVAGQDATQVRVAEDENGSRRIEPIRRSANRFCQGLCGAVEDFVDAHALHAVPKVLTRLQRRFDPEAIRELKADATRDVAVGGPVLAAHAIRVGLVDEYHVSVAPIIVGSGNPYLPGKVRVNLELIDERGFDNGMVHVRYRAKS